MPGRDHEHCPYCGQQLPEHREVQKPIADPLIDAEITAVRNAIANDPALTRRPAFTNWANRRYEVLRDHRFTFDGEVQ